MAMTKEQLLEQMEMDQMIAQAEMAGDPYIQDDRVQLSAPPRGTGDDMYRDMGAIDPSQMNTGAGNMGGIEPETLSNEEFMMAEEFMNSLPPEDKPGFMELFMTKPREALNAVMDTLRQVFDREDAITGENFISYDSEGNATIGQPSDERDEIRRRISMDMGQPAVARSGRDVNSPELDALLDRGAVERGRFQQQEIKPQNFGSLPSVLRSKGVSEKDIYKYLKVLDPSSPIREGEMSRSVVREGE
jgi:hypothetical protein